MARLECSGYVKFNAFCMALSSLDEYNELRKSVKEKLILNLSPNSIIVLDKASHFTLLLEKTPSEPTKNKQEMAE
jgi:hypothetical protein